MRGQAVIFAAMLVMGPLHAESADLVVWWDKAPYPQEDVALAAMAHDFKAQTGLEIEFVRHTFWEVPEKIEAAIAAGRPPDFLFNSHLWQGQVRRWASEGRLVELSDAAANLVTIADADIVQLSRHPDASTGRPGLFALPMGRDTTHIHVWLSLLEQAGFKREDIPDQWEPFWSFWCDRVQPAVRKTLGREDIWATGLPMSADDTDTGQALDEFVAAYTKDWPSPTGPSLLRDAAARTALIKGLAGYTAIYKQGCTPPDAVSWTNIDNNKAFLGQRIVMTINPTLGIPAALKEARPDDYLHNAITIDWPKDAWGRPIHVDGDYDFAVVFKDGGHTPATLAFVRFLAEGGLARYLTDAGDRLLPPSRKLLDYPFWLDPMDPHRPRAAIQVLTLPQVYGWLGLDQDQELRLTQRGQFKGAREAVPRIVVDGLTPEQAADELIAKLKADLGE